MIGRLLLINGICPRTTRQSHLAVENLASFYCFPSPERFNDNPRFGGQQIASLLHLKPSLHNLLAKAASRLT